MLKHYLFLFLLGFFVGYVYNSYLQDQAYYKHLDKQLEELSNAK